MRIFKTKVFNKWAKGLLTDESLLEAAYEIAIGNFDASLGQKVYKQRVASDNKGKSGSTRTIVAFQQGNNAFFMYGFEKGQRANIFDTEKRAFQKLAKIYLEYCDKDLNKAVTAKLFIEIKQKAKDNG